MRILWLSHLVPYPPKGGVLQRSYNLIREVAKYHTVDLLAFNQTALLRPLFDDLDKGLAEAGTVLGSFCDNVEFLPIPSDQGRAGAYVLALKSLITKDPYTINWLKSKSFGKRIEQYLCKHDYDLVHFDTISLIPYMKYVNDVPIVLDHHNIESHMLLRRASKEDNALKKWYFLQEGRRLEKIEKVVCPNFSLNITCSDIDNDRLKSIAPGCKAEVIPNGVDVDYFKHDKSIKQTKSLIFAGTLSWYPNIEAVRFIANILWPRIKELFPDVSIDIIGANPPSDLVDLSKKDPMFRVHGFVDDVRPYIDAAAAYLCPINDGGGTKLKILDALAMQKAIVAHSIACEGIDVTDGEDVMIADDADDYMRCLDKLLNDEDLRLCMGRHARQLAEEVYSYDKVGKKLSRLYEDCVKTWKNNGA